MRIYAAIPALTEYEYLPSCLKAIENQKFKDFSVFICVNQPDNWWDDKEKISICLNNQETLKYLYEFKKQQKFRIEIIDKSSKGKGWQGKKKGIGWARKILMDKICETALDDDIIVSLDADVSFSENYFQSVIDIFRKYPTAASLSNPYYHNLTDNERINRIILRYEIYLRYYSLNLWRIGSPYSFTPTGATIAVPVWVYKKLRGLDPKSSGEDFYFLQKIRKYKKIINYNTEIVYPSARFSDRVIFGTGPAMLKGNLGNWENYSIYNYHLFDQIKETYELFSVLFEKAIETPITSPEYCRNFNPPLFWASLRRNFKRKELFIKACHQKIDAFRIFQFLKSSWARNYKLLPTKRTDEENLKEFLNKFYYHDIQKYNINLTAFSFEKSAVSELNKIRNFLFEKETEYQQKYIFDASQID